MSQENQEVKPGSTWLNFALFIVLFIAIVCIASYVYLKSNNIDPRSVDVKQLLKGNFEFPDKKQLKAGDTVPEIKYDNKERPTFCTYRELLIKCSKDNLAALNKSGDEQWKVPLSMNNPVVKTAGSYLMVYDSGGRDIYVLEGKNVKWSKRLDNNLINADISPGGYVACVREEKGYKSAVTVFNLQGGETFTRNIAEKFVLSAKVSPKAGQVLISSINASGINVQFGFDFVDMAGKPLAGEITYKDEIYPAVWCLNNEGMYAVSDESILYIDKNRQKKLIQQFPGRRIYSSGLLQDKYIAVAISGEEKPGTAAGAPELKVFSAEGKQVAACSLDAEVKSMRVEGDHIALNMGREVHFVNSKGKTLGKYGSKTEILGVYFLNRHEAAVVTKNSVVITGVDN